MQPIDRVPRLYSDTVKEDSPKNVTFRFKIPAGQVEQVCTIFLHLATTFTIALAFIYKVDMNALKAKKGLQIVQHKQDISGRQIKKTYAAK